MTTLYYVELGEFMLDYDDEYQGEYNPWDVPVAVICGKAFYPEQRYWVFDRRRGVSDIAEFMESGPDEDDVWGYQKDKAYGFIAKVDVPDDYADMLTDGESVADSGEEYLSYDAEDIVQISAQHGSLSVYDC